MILLVFSGIDTDWFFSLDVSVEAAVLMKW